MRFTCPTPALMEGLQIVTRALTARTTNPILEGVLLEAQSGRIQLTASDERLTITTRVDCDVREFGRGVLPGKLFSEIVRRLPTDTTEVRMSDRFLFTLTSGASRLNVAGQDPDLYPALPKIDGDCEITLPQDMLRDMIQKTEFAIASDDAREVLTGCLLEIAGGDVTMVALDGFRMAYKRAKCSDVLENVSAIIPGRAVGDIGKLLSGEEDAFATLNFNGNKLQIRLQKTDVYVMLVDGEYINYRRILPTSFNMRAIVNLEALRRAIDRAAPLAREGSNNLIRFYLHDGILEIEANSQMGDAHEEMEVAIDGSELAIAFNVRYMMDVVRAIDAESVEMSFTSSLSPCVISPVGDGDYVHLVLPVRTAY